jgi:hypothetical protein
VLPYQDLEIRSSYKHLKNTKTISENLTFVLRVIDSDSDEGRIGTCELVEVEEKNWDADLSLPRNTPAALETVGCNGL